MSDPGVLPVSVVIPAYERREILPRALRSVFAQRPRLPAEVIVVDDASSDDTAEVAEAMGARVVRLEVNGGAAAARNAGFAAASQPWVALLDSDDEWLPHCLDVLWGLREGHVLVSGSQLSIGDDGWGDRYGGPIGKRTWVLRDPSALVFPKNFVVNSATLVDRAVVNELDGYDTTLRYSEDLDLWLRVLERGTGVCTQTVVTLYHRHAAQKTKNVNPMLDGQLAIVSAYEGRAWWSRALVERRLAVRAWDEWRMGATGGSRLRRLRGLAWVLGRPHRASGLAVLLSWRMRGRRRSSQIARDGHVTYAVFSGPGEPPELAPAGASAVRDLRERPVRARLAELARRPAGRVVVAGRRDALAVRFTGNRPLVVRHLSELRSRSRALA